MLLVTSYVQPDMDGTACVVAYAELLNRQGREAVAALSGTPHLEARHVMGELGLSLPTRLPQNREGVVLVDICRFFQLDPGLKPGEVIEVIDHRKGGSPEDFPKLQHYQVELVGAAATLVYERWRDAGLTPSESSAKLLQAAILSNTVNFKATVTTERDHAAFVALSDIAPLGQDFARRMFLAKSDLAGEKLRECLDGDMSTFTSGPWRISFFQLEIIGTRELLESRAAEIRQIISRTGADRALLSLLDIEQGTTTLLIPDADFAGIVSVALGCAFDSSGISTIRRIIMRKEVRPAVQEQMGVTIAA